MLDIIRLFKDHSIDFVTENHSHARRGWVNVHCPFCQGSRQYHLGYNLYSGYFNCWRCGSHPNVTNTVAQILGVRISEAVKILTEYNSVPLRGTYVADTASKYPFSIPSNLTPLTSRHKRYLERRGYNPEMMEELWGIQSTTAMSNVKYGDTLLSFGYRIYIPIYWENRLVSYIARDVTDIQKAKYLFCPKEIQLVNPKHIIYGSPTVFSRRWTILVEGVLDVWRIGDCAVATFGIQYSQQQVKLLSEAFERIYILYDPEPAALNQAWKLQYDLNAWGAHSMVVNYRGDHDPGDYTDEEVQTLMETIHRTEEQYEYRRSQISIGKHHNSHSRFS